MAQVVQLPTARSTDVGLPYPHLLRSSERLNLARACHQPHQLLAPLANLLDHEVCPPITSEVRLGLKFTMLEDL